MSQNILNYKLFPPLIMIFLLSLSAQLNLNVIYVFLGDKGYSQTEIEHIEVLEMLGLVIFSLLLAQIINLIDIKKIIIFFFTLLIISKFNIFFLSDYNLVKIYFIIFSGCNFGLLVIYLLQIIEFLHKYPYLSVVVPLAMMICARLTGELIPPNLLQLSSDKYEIFNVLLYILILALWLFANKPKLSDTLFKMNILNIIKNMEIELILAFIVGYINATIYWEYEVFAIAENLRLETVEEVRHYMLLSILLLVCPLQIIIRKYDRKIVNLIALSLLTIGVFSLKYIGNDYILNLGIICAVGICLGVILINNLITLIKKFEGENSRAAISFYCSVLALGSYVGISLSEETVNKIGEWGFIYSICFVSSCFLLYYLPQIKKL